MRIALLLLLAGLSTACGSPPRDLLWEYRTERPRWLAGDSQMHGPTVAGSLAVFCGGYGWKGEGSLAAVNVSDGERRWTHPVGRCDHRPLVTATEAIGWGTVGSEQVLMKAADLGSGALLWQRDFSQMFHSAGQRQDTVYLRSADRVTAIHARTGALTTYPIPECRAPEAHAWMVVDASRVVAGCNEIVYTLDGQTLATLGARIRRAVDAALGSDRLYLTEAEMLHAFDLSSGRLLWQRQFAKILGAPLLDGGAVYIHASRPWALRKLGARDGRDVWTSEVRSFHTPLRIADALYTNDGASLVHLDPATGRQVGRWTSPDEISAPPAIAGSVLLFGTLKGVLYAVKAQR